MTEKITEPGQSGTTPEEAAEKAEKKWYDEGNSWLLLRQVMIMNKGAKGTNQKANSPL